MGGTVALAKGRFHSSHGHEHEAGSVMLLQSGEGKPLAAPQQLQDSHTCEGKV